VVALAGTRDIVKVVLRHSGGAVSSLTLAVDAPPAAEREEALFAGEAGVRRVPEGDWRPVQALGLGLDELLTAAAGGPKSELDVRFGAAVTAILAACQEAITTGRVVAV
jgi:hypothetical protein